MKGDIMKNLANGSFMNIALDDKEVNMSKGKWLVVTGLDGSGKTHLVESLAEYYRAQGLKVKTAHLPYDKHLGVEVLPKLKLSYSDRLLFALDNHIFAAQLEEWLDEYDLVISQRGWFDSFVHGAVQGFSYAEIAQLNQVQLLPKCDAMIHLVCASPVAYDRIKDDPDADKFEYPEYIHTQELETRRGFNELFAGNPDLAAFQGCKNFLIDTTWMSIEGTYEQAKLWLNAIEF
ncbi:MAG: hypothetical protein IKF17_04415 [Clostridia bacterium]|nr:hypothetical protein [Clostridia bacterium]